jgi:hypothetical protein
VVGVRAARLAARMYVVGARTDVVGAQRSRSLDSLDEYTELQVNELGDLALQSDV